MHNQSQGSPTYVQLARSDMMHLFNLRSTSTAIVVLFLLGGAALTVAEALVYCMIDGNGDSVCDSLSNTPKCESGVCVAAKCSTDGNCYDFMAAPTCSCTAAGNTCSARIRLLEQRSQFLRKLDAVHEREISAEEQERRLSDVCDESCGVCVAAPSGAPSLGPSESLAPSVDPSGEPSDVPSLDPSGVPSLAPSGAPSLAPSVDPSVDPSDAPSLDPSGAPSLDPTVSLAPSDSPSDTPTMMTTINMSKSSKRAKSPKMTKSPGKMGKTKGDASF